MLDRNPKTRFDIDQVVNSPALKKRLAKFAQPLTNDEYTLLIKNFMVNSPTGLNSDTPVEVLKFACFDIQPDNWVNLQDSFQNTGYILNKGRTAEFKSFDPLSAPNGGQYDKLREFERGQGQVAGGQTWNDFVPPQMESDGLGMKKEGSFQKKPEQQSRTVIKIDNGENPWAPKNTQSNGNPAPAAQPQKPLLNQLYEKREQVQAQVQPQVQSQQQTAVQVTAQRQQQNVTPAQPVQEPVRIVRQASQGSQPQATIAYQTAPSPAPQPQQPTFPQAPFSAHQTAKITKIQLNDNFQDRRHHFGLMSQNSDLSQQTPNTTASYAPQPAGAQEPQYGRQTPQFQKQTGPEIVGSISEFEPKIALSNSKIEALGKSQEQALPTAVRDNVYIKDWWSSLEQSANNSEKAKPAESPRKNYSQPQSPKSEPIQAQPQKTQELFVDKTLTQSGQSGIKIVKRVYASNSFFQSADPTPQLQSVSSAGVSPKANRQANIRYEISAPSLKDFSSNHEFLDGDVNGLNSDLKAPSLASFHSQNATKQTRLKFEIDTKTSANSTSFGKEQTPGAHQQQVANGQTAIQQNSTESKPQANLPQLEQSSQVNGFESSAVRKTDGSFTDRSAKNPPLVYKNGVLTGRVSQYDPQGKLGADRIVDQRIKSFSTSQTPVGLSTAETAKTVTLSSEQQQTTLTAKKLYEPSPSDTASETQRQQPQLQAKTDLSSKTTGKTFKINLSIHDQQRTAQTELKFASPGSPNTSNTPAFNTNESNNLNPQFQNAAENSGFLAAESTAIERSKNSQATVKKFKI